MKALAKLKQAVNRRQKMFLGNEIGNETMNALESSEILEFVYKKALDYPVEHNHDKFRMEKKLKPTQHFKGKGNKDHTIDDFRGNHYAAYCEVDVE